MAKKKKVVKKSVKKKARPAAKKKITERKAKPIKRLPAPTGEQRLWGLISYIFILFILPLVFKRNDAFVTFHAKQGLVFFIAAFATTIFWLIPIAGWIISSILFVVLAVFWVMAVIHVLYGHKWMIPLLGRWSEEMKI